MKLLIIFMLPFLFTNSCDKQAKQELKDTIIEYVAKTRGYNKKITIKNQVVTVSESNRRTNKNEVSEQKISDEDWNYLVTEFKKINLEELNQYNDPTQDRFTDRVAIANLYITFNDKKYESKSFDNGKPPVEIQDFVNKILAIGKTENNGN